MNKLLFFITFITHVPVHTMLFDNSILLPEIQHKILDFAATSGKNSKESAYTINALSLTNQPLHVTINDPEYTNNLIQKLAKKYECSHETIAKRLCIKPARERLALQYRLQRLCCCPQNQIPLNIHEQLKELKEKGINLEFTYNHNHQHKTPLMITMGCKNGISALLLGHGANINGCNASGTTALHLVCKEGPIDNIKQLIKHPQLAINQRNNNGENALLYLLTHIKRFNKRSARLCTMLLTAGVDPECTSKKGKSPLSTKIIKKLHAHHPILQLIHSAIKQKYDSIALRTIKTAH